MTSLEGWGAFMLLMLLVWSTDIVDWVVYFCWNGCIGISSIGKPLCSDGRSDVWRLNGLYF